MKKSEIFSMALAGVLLFSFILPNTFAFSLGNWNVSSLTGDFGFHFHYFVERLKLTFTFNKAKKTDIALSLAQMQLQRANEYVKKGDYEKAAKAMEKYEKLLALANKEAEEAKINSEVMEKLQEKMKMVAEEQKMIQEAMMNKTIANMNMSKGPKKENSQALKELMEIIERSQEQQKMLSQRILMRINETQPWGNHGIGNNKKMKHGHMPSMPTKNNRVLRAKAGMSLEKARIRIEYTGRLLEYVKERVNKNATLSSNKTIITTLNSAEKTLNEAERLYVETQGLFKSGKYQLVINNANKIMALCEEVLSDLHRIMPSIQIPPVIGANITNATNRFMKNITRNRGEMERMMEKGMPKISKPLNKTLFMGPCIPNNLNKAFENKNIPCRVVRELNLSGIPEGQAKRLKEIYLVRCKINTKEFSTFLNGRTCRMLVPPPVQALNIPLENITFPPRNNNTPVMPPYKKSKPYTPPINIGKVIHKENVTINEANCTPESIERYMRYEKHLNCTLGGVPVTIQGTQNTKPEYYTFRCRSPLFQNIILRVNQNTCTGTIYYLSNPGPKPGVVKAL